MTKPMFLHQHISTALTVSDRAVVDFLATSVKYLNNLCAEMFLISFKYFDCPKFKKNKISICHECI